MYAPHVRTTATAYGMHASTCQSGPHISSNLTSLLLSFKAFDKKHAPCIVCERQRNLNFMLHGKLDVAGDDCMMWRHIRHAGPSDSPSLGYIKLNMPTLVVVFYQMCSRCQVQSAPPDHTSDEASCSWIFTLLMTALSLDLPTTAGSF